MMSTALRGLMLRGIPGGAGRLRRSHAPEVGRRRGPTKPVWTDEAVPTSHSHRVIYMVTAH